MEQLGKQEGPQDPSKGGSAFLVKKSREGGTKAHSGGKARQPCVPAARRQKKQETYSTIDCIYGLQLNLWGKIAVLILQVLINHQHHRPGTAFQTSPPFSPLLLDHRSGVLRAALIVLQSTNNLVWK